ncbi:laccase 2 [Daedaleopsis nitida]|nr:laccase 2 [Daedaleopsis nitida]
MSKFQSLAAFVAICLAHGRLVAGAIGPVADFTVSNANISPDGFTRAAIVVNNQFPGPLITGNKGDNFKINVIDDLTDDDMLTATTIHWHGFFQKGTNWADGPAFVNQCPISKGNSFLYDFSSTTQAGTFWYHSHLSTQYCDGLRGPMVVYDPNDPHKSLYDVDDESTIITLVDWYHTLARQGPRFPLGADSVLINGLGRAAGGDATALSVITVTKGKRYRFRLVNISCDPNFVFSIQGHSMTVIEADSVSVTPYTVDSIHTYAGMRYSFVLNADQDESNYWIWAIPSVGTVTTDGGVNSAILRYDTAEVVEPDPASPSSSNPLVEANLVPLTDLAAPGNPTVGGVDYALNLDFSFNGTEFFINGSPFVPPTVPVLLQIMSGTQDAASLLPSGSVYSLPSNAVVELSFPITATNAPGAPHPFHLHGVSLLARLQHHLQLRQPPQRDVVNTGTAGDNVTIRFRTDNPGPWFLHCHIDFHLEAGFAVVLAEDIPDVADANSPSAAWNDLCPTYNSVYPNGL